MFTQHHRMLTFFWFLLIVACFTGCAVIKLRQEPLKVIAIEDKDLLEDQIFFTEPMFGYRKVSAEFFTITGTKAKQVGIPVDIFIESAKATPWIKSAIKKSGKDPAQATFDDWYGASKRVAGLTKATANQMSQSLECSSIIYESICVDPLLMISLPDTEIFKSDKPVTFVDQVGGKEIELIEVDPKAFETFKYSYTLLSSASSLPSYQAHQSFKYANASMASLPFLAAATEFNAGRVTFGKPIIYTSEEQRLVIPQSIISTNDVYWIEFAVSYRDIDFQNIEKLTFGVIAPTGVVALDLIPLRFDKEISVTRTISSPKIKAQYGDKAVELGKVYEQQVVYKSLKPTIIAEGLQESEFMWSLTEDSVQPGSKRFIGIISVPKGKESLPLQFQASAKTRPRYLGFVQGDIISTKPRLVEVSLK